MATRNRNNRKSQVPATAMEENNMGATLALPAGRNMEDTTNLLEAPAATAPALDASAPAALDASATVYSASMFNTGNPASARLPMLAAHILTAIGSGKHSTCQIYNFLRDVCGWTKLPGSVAFRNATETAGMLLYTDTNGKPLQSTGKRTRCVAGPALASIARCYNAPAVVE